MSSAHAIYGLWIAGFGLEVSLVIVLLIKRAWHLFPGFALYSAVSCFETILLYFMPHKGMSYFWVYWICEGAGIFLGFWVVYEIFRKLLASHAALRGLAAAVFRWSLLGLAIFGLIVFYRHSSLPSTGFITGIVVSEEAVRIVEVGLLLALFVFSAAFGLHWRQQVFGISVGLGLFTAVELAAIAMRVQFGVTITPAFNVIRMTAFNISLLIWIGYMLVPERATATELPQSAQLEQWNQAIMELIHQ